MCIHIYIYIYTYPPRFSIYFMHYHIPYRVQTNDERNITAADFVVGLVRRRENVVGVNMVLAESFKFKHGLYKSCVIEWFEGIMLEPCLLQPCFHVAA